MREIWLACGLLAACGGSTPPPPKPVEVAPAAPVVDSHSHSHEREQREHDQAVAAHRKLEDEQQTALGASCTETTGKHERCTPSCYTAEAADPRATKKLKGAVEIQHLVCQRPDSGPYMISDELAPKLQIKPARRAGKPHKKGAWQAEVETAFKPELIVVTGTWHEVTQPLTHEHLRCVAASQYVSIRRPVDACGSTGDIVCEASGNAAAHGLDVVRFRLEEARQLQASGNNDGCQQAALEAIAVARGLPRWRQYAKLNVGQWPTNARFRTRFDGILDEDTLFANAQSLGAEAEAVFATCGGAASAPTTPEQEQSFHTCW